MNEIQSNPTASSKESEFAKTCLATGIAFAATVLFFFIPVWRSSRHLETVGRILYYGLPIPIYEKTESGWGFVFGNLSLVIPVLDCWFWLSLALWFLGVRRIRQYLVGCLCYVPLSLLILFVIASLIIRGPL